MGRVIAYADGVAKVYGLKDVMSYEVVEFDTGDRGLASNLEEGCIGVIVLGGGKNIKEGTSVKRTKQLISPRGRCCGGAGHQHFGRTH